MSCPIWGASSHLTTPCSQYICRRSSISKGRLPLNAAVAAGLHNHRRHNHGRGLNSSFRIRYLTPRSGRYASHSASARHEIVDNHQSSNGSSSSPISDSVSVRDESLRSGRSIEEFFKQRSFAASEGVKSEALPLETRDSDIASNVSADGTTTGGGGSSSSSAMAEKRIKRAKKKEKGNYPTTTGSFQAGETQLRSLNIPGSLPPSLSYGLDRVLFNPGVYHLQDPRSRVFNFDPYLEKLIAPDEFDFDALAKYRISSEDENLDRIAQSNGIKYSTSTSSVSHVLQQFHFLLSGFRELNGSMLSRQFEGTNPDLTDIQYLPASVFLRLKNGRYALDKDSHMDDPHELMFVGKSMEKLLTSSQNAFERYRKSSENPLTDEERSKEESYHYAAHDRLLVRAQLDAHDPRLPGSGIFDIKTRAVAPIRLDYRQRLKIGRNYEIKQGLGNWESYEREYYDMMRTTMMKYSLQVRLGMMDGIFVAFHNMARIFGFQYISLEDMDFCLHAQRDRALGDQELNISLSLLQMVLDRAAEKFPDRSLWIHLRALRSHMYITAEPVTDEKIETLNAQRQVREDEFVRALLNPESASGSSEVTGDLSLDDSGLDGTNHDPVHLNGGGATDSIFDSREASAKLLEDLETLQTSAELLSSEAKVLQSMADNAGSPPSPKGLEEKTAGSVEKELITDLVSRAIKLNAELDKVTMEVKQQNAENDKLRQRIQEVRNLVSGPHSLFTELQEEVMDEAEQSLEKTEAEEIESVAGFDTLERIPSEYLVFKLEITNKVDGKTVKRPENLTPANKWAVDYSLKDITNAEEALAKFRSLVNAKMKAEQQKEKRWEGFYNSKPMRRLMELSIDGKKWREKLDRIESQRETVIFEPRHSIS